MNGDINSTISAGLSPVAEAFLFYLLAGATIVGATLMITRKNAIHSAMAMAATLIAMGGLYLLLYAPFVAALQIVVVAGGITTLFLFAIMRVNSALASPATKERLLNRMWPAGFVAGVALLTLFVFAFVKGRALFPDRMLSLPQSNSQQIATMLYGGGGKMGEYTLVFEISSLLLLAAILGAVVMTARKP
jgi:NADH-quinone oxidoreductase subunit J